MLEHFHLLLNTIAKKIWQIETQKEKEPLERTATGKNEDTRCTQDSVKRMAAKKDVRQKCTARQVPKSLEGD